MKIRSNKYYVFAIFLALVLHGTAMFFTLEESYDALIHLFFAEHYANNWSDPWSYKWYTGFSVLGYPPLIHQVLALLSFIGGLKFALYIFTVIVILLFVTGTYRYSYLITKNAKYAGIAAIFSVFSSVYLETLHVFGQLPTLVGISLLMHALPSIYIWIRKKRGSSLVSALLLMGLMVCSHHVTPIFGIVFFILPIFGLAVIDNCHEKLNSYENIHLKDFIKQLILNLKEILIFSISSLVLIVVCILPYWLHSKNNPITQVPIPHGSRDNFLEVLSSGLVFFIIPYGVILCLLPYVFYRFFSKRLFFFGLSFSMLFLLGTGGTTPLPRLILGDNAFSILTLDRFTFWASIMSFPLVGEFLFRLFKSDYKTYLIKRTNRFYYKLSCFLLIGITTFFTVFTINLGKFRPSQPKAINMLSIVNFINQDEHYKWRYLTLGFGDQMAWLASQTRGLTVDGNYHSARRLPELTTRAVERLENSKYKGIEGIGSLQQFLANSERFHLKFIFSNDKFYDPILYFCGWEKLSTLENHIVVWEKQNIKPLPTILTRVDVPFYQKIMWSFIPVFLLSLCIIWFFRESFLQKKKVLFKEKTLTKITFSKSLQYYNVLLFVFIIYGFYNLYADTESRYSPQNVVKAYYDAIDIKDFEEAHKLLDKNAKKSLDQFMLEIAVSDGILSSYSKLQEIRTKIIKEEKDTVFINAHTKWITPLEIIEKNEVFKTTKQKRKWCVVPKKNVDYIPSNQFFDQGKVTFYNQGRRKITTQQTYHEDVLPQPVLFVLNASLIKNKLAYHIVGEVQNIDYFPAAIGLRAELYDESDELLAVYSSNFESKYHLNPYEKTPFKIDFEEIAWINSNKENGSFNPKEFHLKQFNKEPVKFILHVSSSVSTRNLYQETQLSDIVSVKGQKIEGVVFNSGDKEVTVPQLLFSYKNEGKLIWLDHLFINSSIRPHRKKEFMYSLKEISDQEVVLSSTDECYVNGMPNNDIYHIKKLGNHRNEKELKLDVTNNLEIEINVNNFIGNE